DGADSTRQVNALRQGVLKTERYALNGGIAKAHLCKVFGQAVGFGFPNVLVREELPVKIGSLDQIEVKDDEFSYPFSHQGFTNLSAQASSTDEDNSCLSKGFLIEAFELLLSVGDSRIVLTPRQQLFRSIHYEGLSGFG